MQILYLVWLLLPWLQGLMALLLKCTLTHKMQRVMVAKRSILTHLQRQWTLVEGSLKLLGNSFNRFFCMA